MLTVCVTAALLLIAMVPLEWTAFMANGPSLGAVIFGSMPGLCSITLSPMLHACGILLLFSLLFDLFYQFLFSLCYQGPIDLAINRQHHVSAKD